MAVLHPLECYLLEQFSSPERFASTRDAIVEWIDAHEAAYARLHSQLDSRQHNKPQWQQGDLIWGDRVLPNIRGSRDYYIKAYIQRVNNDPSAFKAGFAMRSHRRGIVEFWDGWMTEEEQQCISNTEDVASRLDQQLGATNRGTWDEGHLTYIGQGRVYQVSDLPRRIPRYVLDSSVRVEINEGVKQVGLYLPDVDFTAARLLYPTEFEGGTEAYQGVRHSDYVNENTGKRAYDWEESQWTETGWTLIRRVEGEFIDVPEQGFFPKGEPEELYTWPEREAQFIRRDDGDSRKEFSQ
ncbi:type VI secretion protein ImpA [Pseudomonas fluorescens]|uniref:type VI secretion protein ImpA n=1 Tax=Pseudomonas fluorescens TaxID=294 RepID=UPI00177A9BFC|nr:type VI secretion protein ImpA [Pseudomonas fluorescens]